MTQDQAIILGFKVTEVASLVTIVAFVAYYTRLAPWYRNPIGRTIVFKDLALILVLLPSVLSIFLSFNRLTSHIAAWFDVASFALVPVIMIWRIIVWRRLDRLGLLSRNGHRKPGGDADG
jgi:dolichyl-phosphate-mannose--protein O-mannosyl transferase